MFLTLKLWMLWRWERERERNPPCHALPREQWCDRLGPGGFMGHACGTRPEYLKGFNPILPNWCGQMITNKRPRKVFEYTREPNGVRHWWVTFARVHGGFSSRPVWGYRFGRTWVSVLGAKGFRAGVGLQLGRLTVTYIYGRNAFSGIDAEGRGVHPLP